MTDALLDAIGFDTHFPAMAKPQAPDTWDLLRADDAKRDAHVAKVLPDLIRLFSVTPQRIADGVDHVAMYLVERHPALVAAIAHRDEAEIGRLLLVGVDARIKTVAEDAAEDESYDLVPERPL
jgi:hypothetical protein